ncbi:unnamed protein product [Orchesella dallaii]|uniref:Uncharacterized protein n=1 Tax=Orchesella dallaii TaxID=48710 RepID=A0ABP1QN52_9HEXA
MEKRILAIGHCPLTLPMSPCGLHIIDGNGTVLAHLIYQIDKDVAVPVAYDEATVEIYENWGTPKAVKAPLHLPSDDEDSSLFKDAPLIVKIPPEWVQNRNRMTQLGGHWFGYGYEPGSSSSEDFSMYNLTPKIVPTGQITGRGDVLINEWRSNHPVFHKLGLLRKGHVNQDFNMLREHGDPAVSLEDLPLEVYEVLVKYLNGVAVINLCEALPLVESTLFETLSSPKRDLRWYYFCTNDLYRPTVLKIVRSYDARFRSEPSTRQQTESRPIWRNVFTAYQSYWSTLSNGTIKVTDLAELERKLKGELLFHAQSPQPKVLRNSAYWTTRCAGAGILYNVIFPCPSTPLNEYNLTVVKNMEEVNCKHFAAICQTSSPSSYYVAKLAHFPVPRNGTVEKTLPEVDRLVIGVCEECINVSNILGCRTTKRNLRLRAPDFCSSKMDPIIEISDDIIAMWLDPLNLIFFMLVPATNGYGYAVNELYRLSFPKMGRIWDKIAEHRSDFIPVLKEYKGVGPPHDRPTVEEGGYPFQPTEGLFYGLTFVSHIYGVESFRPSDSSNTVEAFVDSVEPRYYSNNGRQHLPLLLKAECSGKGHGMFIFCSNEAVAVSWDSITWVFDAFPSSKIGEFRHVYHVEIIYDDGALVVVDENIIFMKITLKFGPPNIVNGINLTEPVLEVKPVRIIKLDFFPWHRKITQVELDFENGEPFLFIIAERVFRKVDKSCELNPNTGLEFVMKRIDFVNAEDSNEKVNC